MLFDIDTMIFLGFLIVNIMLGLSSSKGIKTIKEYAIGNRDFSTATIVATIVATWISGEFFIASIEEIYRDGFYHLFASIGDIVCILVVGLFFAPRMGEFLGKISIAEAMGSIYGQKVRIITAIFGSLGVGGIIATQLKVAGITFEYALQIPSIYGILVAGFIITLYSSLGGIKSVTFTDIIQFFTFSVVIPLVAYILLKNVDNTSNIEKIFSTNELFDFSKVLDFTQPKSLYYLSLFLCFALPAFNPAIFQRIAMAKDVKQVTSSFTISALVCFILLLILSWISIIMISINPNINSKDILKHIIFDHTSIGMRGVILVGILATVMSTIDSYINSTSVIIIHDFCAPLNIGRNYNELILARIGSLIIGIFSISLATIDIDIMGLITLAFSFYMPIVSVPFIMAVLGFRSSERAAIIGMASGLIAVITWNYILKITALDSVIVGMTANLIGLMGTHYLFKEKGGWVGIKDQKTLSQFQNERKEKVRKLIRDLKSFDIIAVCKRNYPKGEGLISILGLFVMIVTFSSVNYLEVSIQDKYKFILDSLYPIILFSSSALISYPLWLENWKKSEFISIIWNLIMFFVLICFSYLILLISNFAEIQLIVFMTNILVIISLIRWKWALFNILAGLIITTYLYKHFIYSQVGDLTPSFSQFKSVYLMLLTSGSLVLFLKPRQQSVDLVEENNLFLSAKVDDQRQELTRLTMLKNEFLRNLEHEAHTPITGITSMGQVLDDAYDKLSETQRRNAIRNIAKSSERLTTLVNNLIDLSKLENFNYKLNKRKVYLTQLVYNRLELCQKLYSEEIARANLSFNVEIEENIEALCDEYYISRTIDNIIINAIQYSKKGTITVSLNHRNNLIEFSAQDEGIGIPKEEIYDIFEPFIVSSKTKTPSGGRGIGLALCKKVITAHDGNITVDSSENGSIFRFTVNSK